MKKQAFTYIAFLVSYFLFISLYRNWLDLGYWPFWLGGLIGIILPELDHVVYVFFSNPREVTSQRVQFLCKNGQYKRCVRLMLSTGRERMGLIFHTIFFQAIFFVLTFWVMTSSISLFGKGIVLAFSLHLVVDQIVGFFDKGEPSKTTLVVVILLVLIFGFLL
ncbi:MAG: hypothetical protein Q8P91_02705 [bacterium]|nr:hypothetical protein [bacterium]